MTDVFDEQSGGLLPIQHHDRAYDIPERHVLKAVRSKGLDAMDRDEIDETVGVSDVLGSLILKPSGVGAGTASGSTTVKAKREIAAWGFGFPAITTAASRKTGKVHRVKVRPVGDDALNQDARFLEVDCLTPSPCGAGEYGTLLAATEEYQQLEVFLPGASALKAPHFGKPGSSGTLVYDLDQQGKLDPDRKAELQHLTRAHKVPESCGGNLYGKPQSYGLSLQFDFARDVNRGGTFADGPGPVQRIAGLGKDVGGPLFSGAAGCQHEQGTNDDGETFAPGHLSTKSLHAKPGDPLRDAPLPFTDEVTSERVYLPGVDVETRITFDPLGKHSTPCGAHNGLWRLLTRVPLYTPPPPPPPPPTDGGGGGGGGGRDWPTPFPPKRPTGPGRPPISGDPFGPIGPGGTLINLQPPWVYDNDPCRRRAVSTLSEFGFPSISYQAQDYRAASREYLYSPWTQADAARESKTRPTVLRTDVVARNDKGIPRLTRKAPCPYPGGTASGVVVDFSPETGAREQFAGTTPGTTTSTSGRMACGTFTGWGCPNDDGTVTGFKAQYTGGILTIDKYTSDTSTATAKLELDSTNSELRWNGVDLSAGGSTPFGYGGDGSDGAVLFDSGGADTAFATRSGTTWTLSRTVLGTTIQLDSGVTLATGGYHLLATTSINLDGTVNRAGSNGSGTTGGTGAAATGAGDGGNTGTGANGSSAVAVGTNGSSTTSSGGGGGGNGGASGGAEAGGTGGTATVPTAGQTPFRDIQAAALLGKILGTSVTRVAGGASGASGGNASGAGTSSGAGGGGGGTLAMIAPTITVSATGTVSLKGGNGSNASGAGNAGGGGGGGGGLLYIVARTYTNSGTVTVAGGTGGTKVGLGSNGADGSAGNVLSFTA